MKALIISVGGSPEPIIRSIQEHEPDFVCFYLSESCMELIGPIKTASARTFRDRKILVEDPQDLSYCYETALKSCRIVTDEGFGPDDVVVDMTGGTKVMSAALVLATVARGYRYSYVAGTARTKDGLGTVIQGSEFVKQTENPWDLAALTEKQRICWAFNHHAHDLAAELAEGLAARSGLSPQVKALVRALAPLLRAYAWWDRFEHAKIGRAFGTAVDALSTYRDVSGSRELDGLVARVQENKAFLDGLLDASKGFKKLCSHHVSDLVGNARRRAAEGKYDDAIARLYRALEMVSQVALARQEPSIDTARVSPAAVPESIREEFLTRYLEAEKGVMKIPLLAAFRLLQALDHPVGHRYFQSAEDFGKVLAGRNESILAHGIQVNQRSSFEKLLSLLEPLLEQPSPTFPELILGDEWTRQKATPSPF